MLKNSELIQDFKKSLSATVKSIGKNDDLEINYVKENPSISGNTINLTEPNIENIRNNLTYLRAEADSLALEFRLHSKEIHQNFINNDEPERIYIYNSCYTIWIIFSRWSRHNFNFINHVCI